MLYSANTFHIMNPYLFKELSSLILPRRFQAIRSMILHIRLIAYPSLIPEMKEDYDEKWHIIASMRRLRKLRILLELPMQNADVWRENEHVLLDPIMAFRPLERFDVYVTIFRDWLSKEKLT